jgi:hypothetical protein
MATSSVAFGQHTVENYSNNPKGRVPRACPWRSKSPCLVPGVQQPCQTLSVSRESQESWSSDKAKH